MGLLLLITALIAFFVGLVVGAAIAVFTEGSPLYPVRTEDSYQPFEK